MTRDEDFEDTLEKIREKIRRDEEKIYSQKVIHEYRHPTNFGSFDHPDATGEIRGVCGDTMKMDLRIQDNVIQDARFWTDGCGASLACGNMLSSLIKKKHIHEAMRISSEQLLEVLGGLPQENHHCAALAVATLSLTLENYRQKKVPIKR